MSCSNVCIRAIPPLLLSFLLQVACAQNVDTTKKNIQTVYTNFRGKTVTLKGGSNYGKMIVLTESSNDSIIRQAIQDNETIDYPSQAVIDSMQKAYDLADGSQGIERLFFVGKKKAISFIAAGTKYEVDSLANLQARMDLHEKKMDEPAYDVHTHGHKLDGEDDPYFAPGPSPTDRRNRNFRDRTEPNAILTYIKEEIVHTLDAGNKTSIGKKNYEYIPTIIFYTPNKIISSQNFFAFKELVKRHAGD